MPSLISLPNSLSLSLLTPSPRRTPIKKKEKMLDHRSSLINNTFLKLTVSVCLAGTVVTYLTETTKQPLA